MKAMHVLLAVLLLATGGCVTGEKRVESGPTPAQIVKSGEAAGAVHWGGRIVRVENLSNRTLVEVLSYPLDSQGVPQTNKAPGGRFMIEKAGFLEPHEYRPERFIEVRGQLSGFRNGQVGDAEYRYPLVKAERLILRAEKASVPGSPRFRFGFGTGTYGSGSGVGISF